MKDYRDLRVWQKSMNLVEEAYRLTRLLPREERFALFDQIRRAAISIPSNIAEGYGRNSVKDYIRFINISRGSKNELETQLLICVRLQYFSDEQITIALQMCEEVGKMLNALLAKLTPFI